SPTLFRNAFFLMAYSPVASSGMHDVMPSGESIWDELTPVGSSDAVDPHHVLAQFDLPSLRRAFVDGLIATVSRSDNIDALKAIFSAYMSNCGLILTADEQIAYVPPDTSIVADVAGTFSTDDYTRLINGEARGYARDALIWALSAVNPEVQHAFSGMRASHPRTGAVYAGWERSPWTVIHSD